MSVIFPGNYVRDLNAYRGQGVIALPGVYFYQVRGYAPVTEDLSGGGTLSLVVPSPDLRQDDKPRLDKPFTVPEGATVYRTAVNAVNLKAAGTESVSVTGPATAAVLATQSAVDGEFDENGASNEFAFTTALTPEAAEITVGVSYSGSLEIVDADTAAEVIVEVCYFMDAPGPAAEDIPLPYKTEAGQGY